MVWIDGAPRVQTEGIIEGHGNERPKIWSLRLIDARRMPWCVVGAGDWLTRCRGLVRLRG